MTSILDMKMMLKATYFTDKPTYAEPPPISRFKKTTPFPPSIFFYQSIEVIFAELYPFKTLKQAGKICNSTIMF